MKWLEKAPVEPQSDRRWVCNGFIKTADDQIQKCPWEIWKPTLFEALQEYAGHGTKGNHVDPRTGKPLKKSQNFVQLKKG